MIKKKMITLFMVITVCCSSFFVVNKVFSATPEYHTVGDYTFNLYYLDGYTDARFLRNKNANFDIPHLVVKNSKGYYGLVDIKGNIKIPVIYDRLEDAIWDYVVIHKNDKYGISDINGNIVLELGKYDSISTYHDEIFIGYVGGQPIPLDNNFMPYGNLLGLVDYKLFDVFDYKLFDDWLPSEKDGKKGIYSKDGTEVLPLIYDDIQAYPRDDDKHFYILKKGESYSLADNMWNIVLEIYFPRLDAENDIIVISDQEDRKRLFSLSSGKMVGTMVFERLSRYNEELFFFANENQGGLIDENGDIIEIVSVDYGRIMGRYKDGLYEVNVGDMYDIFLPTYYYIDSDGKAVSDKYYHFSRISGDDSNNLKVVQRFDKNPTSYRVGALIGLHYFNGDEVLDEHFGFIDSTGNEVTELKYDFCNIHKGWNIVQFNNKYGFIDEYGKEEFVPPIYDDYQIMNEERAFVKMNEKWGMIDNHGNIIYPCELNGYPPKFYDNISITRVNGKVGALDINGNIRVPFIYETLCSTRFTNDLAVFARGFNRMGFDYIEKAQYELVSSKGETLISFGQFFAATNMENTAFAEKTNSGLKIYHLINAPSISSVAEKTGIESADVWAKDEIDKAIKSGFGTKRMTMSNYKSDTTRSEFSEIVMKLYDALNGPDVVNKTNPFSDTYDSEVIRANNAGIVQGSNGLFEPYGELTREQLCVMIVRALKQAGISINENINFQNNYMDLDSVSSWAMDSVRILNGYKILNGSGKTLMPANKVDKQTALILLYRTYENFKP